MSISFPNGFNCPLYTGAVQLMRNRDFTEAEPMMRSSLIHEGETALSYHYLAEIVASRTGRIEEAIALQEKALSLAPSNSVFIAALGSRLKDGGFDRQALKILETALAIDENSPIALPLIMRLRRKFLAWKNDAQERRCLERMQQANHRPDPLALFTYIDDPQAQLDNASLRAPKSRRAKPAPHEPGNKIRVGYFSSDFFEHPTMHLFRGALKAHDRDKFEFYVYDLLPKEQSEESAFVRNFADHYRDVSNLTPEETADLSIRDRVDIAVDLKGDTFASKQEIFAYGAAPVQVSFLGFPGTTGMDMIDYMIADEVTIPEGSERYYSETILRLPNCYQPNSNCRHVPEVRDTRADYNLPQDKFVFANLNNTYKVGPREFAAWMKILKRAPDSVLLFYMGNADIAEVVAQKAEAHGVAPDRIIPCGALPQAAHIDRISQVDLCLDCFSCNAHTTASDILWAGVPILTLAGKQFAARVASSVLSAANLPELSVKSEKLFIDKAVSLAKNPDEISRIKHQLREQRFALPLFDTEAWTRDYERALYQIYHESHSAAGR
ncbi:UDP-N-acetylglucosamine-peptide N-acetylglucosaminyltransferase [Phaeobacter sp. S60]|uniref:O-linked N-acetylglucosamine transferase, SPINDLY family protein n=1 Tax=Phaeobacter sp. S60 TaxID=1569353 RepID=UPI00058CDEDE|nr:UDP-N-acetylglucosamine-peptide N-acetylglucosaminyltransferase [Phaeobacter sp. S60]KII18035.1 UDP-N-acetylglucosamine-peptide N-acetylglucosaminyltransferase [Phaeobacter sp. S60]